MTIGYKYSGPRRNWEDVCDYCGVSWHRNRLKLDQDGYLACPDDSAGRVNRVLNMLNAAGAATGGQVRGKRREGPSA